MAIMVREPESSHPDILAPNGLQSAVCSDVVDLGEVESAFGGESRMKHMIKIVFLLNERIPGLYIHPHTADEVKVPEHLEGRPFGVSRRFTLSLHEKASLRKLIRSWRGREFTSDELRGKGFDLESLIGLPVALSIVHVQSESTDRYFANIESASRLPAEWTEPEIPGDYVRAKDREARNSPSSAPVSNPPKSKTPPPPGQPPRLRDDEN